MYVLIHCHFPGVTSLPPGAPTRWLSPADWRTSRRPHGLNSPVRTACHVRAQVWRGHKVKVDIIYDEKSSHLLKSYLQVRAASGGAPDLDFPCLWDSSFLLFLSPLGQGWHQ